ncbi:MAG: hypothetical protein ISP24_03485 [Rickettsiales bacterium]|nr:hypothetical protein [Rickettsiales bacterium]
MIWRLISVLLISFSAFARPVSYSGGVTWMQMNDKYSNSLHLHYSPNAKTSIGYKGEYFRSKKWQLHALQYNALLKRWNGKASQANIYLKSAFGLAYDQDKNLEKEAGFLGLAMDAENRRLFASYENRYLKAADFEELIRHKVRLGVAPYIGDYGDLHSWLMVEISNNEKYEKDSYNITPFVRFFKDVYLVEIGANADGKILFNSIIRF